MNPTALLGLISNLYEQLVASQERVARLEAELAASRDSETGSDGPSA